MKLSRDQITMMKLILRSRDTGDGWRNVSKNLSNHVKHTTAKRPELYELNEDSEKLCVRLSPRGVILGDYI